MNAFGVKATAMVINIMSDISCGKLVSQAEGHELQDWRHCYRMTK